MIQKKKVKIISTKWLTADLINKYSFINGNKYFSLDWLKSYLAYKSFSNYVVFEADDDNDNISSWKFIGLSREKNY